MMKNVCRVFNDPVGVELVERTGRNPQYVYLSLGCSKAAERRMLHYAKTKCVGKPFSNIGMALSLLWPRQTSGDAPSSFFCAELVAAILKEGGLMDPASNPGSATPETLHRIYKDRAAVTANPYVLRDVQSTHGITLAATVGTPNASGGPHGGAGAGASASASADGSARGTNGEGETMLQTRAILNAGACPCARTSLGRGVGAGAGNGTGASRRLGERRGDSPPKAQFRVISEAQRARTLSLHPLHGANSGHGRGVGTGCATGMHGGPCGQGASAGCGFHLTLHSLDMSQRR